MTQPVQEPSPERGLQAANWRTSQLARRPPLVPGGGENLAMAYITWDSVVIPTGLSWNGIDDDTAIMVDAYTNPAADETLPGAAAPHMTIDIPNGQVDFCSGGVAAEPRRYGVYHIQAAADFTTAGWAGSFGLMIDVNPAGQLPYFYDAIEVRDAALIDTVPSYDKVTVDMMAIMPGNTFSFIGVAALQDSGSDVDITVAGLLVKQVGWWSNTEGTFWVS